MPARSLVLTKNAQQTGTAYGQMGFRFTVVASSATGGLPNEIFRFLRRPVDPGNLGGTQEDVFSGVCRPEELAALPANNPLAGSDPAWLRLTSLDLIFASEIEAASAWTQIKSDVQVLLQALAKMDTLSSQEVVTIAY